MSVRVMFAGSGLGGDGAAPGAGGGHEVGVLRDLRRDGHGGGGPADGSRGVGPARTGRGRVGMNIGEAAARSGVSAKMIRHYESIGLIAAELRANGYRSYGPQDVAVLRFIRHARDLAFPLEDIRKLLGLWRDRSRASAEVKRMALAHVAALEAKAVALNAVADSLRHLASHCHGDDRPDCPILDELEGGKG